MRWKPLILCVDDTPSWLEGQKMLLEESGYRVLTATNGTDALQAFLLHSVDLVLLDYHMAGMNGGVVAARMKDSKPDVPVAPHPVQLKRLFRRKFRRLHFFQNFQKFMRFHNFFRRSKFYHSLKLRLFLTWFPRAARLEFSARQK